MTQVFISYSRKDVSFVKQLASDLKIADFDAWYDLSGLEGGMRWSREIEKAIRASEYVIVVLSPNSIVSEWVEEEILLARKLKRKIIPLLYKPCDIPLGFHTINFIDVQGSNYQQNYQEILRALDIERSKREIAEKARQAARKAVVKRIFSNIFSVIQRSLTSLRPNLRFVGAIVMAAILFWAGSWAIPKFVALIPTPQFTAIATQREATSTNSPISPTKTPKPNTTPSAPTSTKTPVFTSTPTPLLAEITDAKGVTMRLVPEGTFTMGSNDFYDMEKPIHEVYLDSYYMDIYEVTNEAYRDCVEDGICLLPSNTDIYNDPIYASHPVVYIRWSRAKTYCEWRGARLPTEAEWEKAARGTDGRTYPWGEDISCERANYKDSCVGGTTEVGSYESGKGPYGMYDMAGNVFEWTSSLYQPYPYDANDGRESLSSFSSRVWRGGSWWNYAGFGVPSAARSRFDPNGTFIYLGFRCARDANP